MTLTINGFTITGTPEEINSFIKLYSCKTETFINTTLLTEPIHQVLQWTITCNSESIGDITCSKSRYQVSPRGESKENSTLTSNN